MLSLSLGIRVKSGGSVRRFEPDGDPRGVPEHDSGAIAPQVNHSYSRSSILPNALGTHTLNEMIHFPMFPKVTAEEAMAIIRSSRIYQEAIWISDTDPALSWLLLVSSIEAAAEFWRKEKDLPIERLRASKPELEEVLLEYGNGDLVQEVAVLMANFMGATKKFVDFLITYLPKPPEKRPPAGFQILWDEENLSKSFKKIYDWRSKALHGGTPFPLPMCNPPHNFKGYLAEKPIGLASEAKGGVWVAKDIPMLLHTFEYIARHSLLNWWGCNDKIVK